MSTQRQFQVVPDDETDDITPTRTERAGVALLMAGLGALSQRALTAVKDIFTLLSVGTAFWLWWSTPEPNVLQIVSLSLYALFILTANWIVRRA